MRAPNHKEKARRGKGIRCFFPLFFLDSSVTRENDRRRLSCPEQYTGRYRQYRASAAQRVERVVLRHPGFKQLLCHFIKAVNSKRYALAAGNSGIVVKKCVSTFVMARHFSLEEGYRQAKEGKANWGDRLISPDLEPGFYIKL